MRLFGLKEASDCVNLRGPRDMFDIKIITGKISIQELKEMSKDFSEQLVKAVVDIQQKKMAVFAAMHADEEALLLETGSEQQDLWGINLYPYLPKSEWIEFDSMINIRPWQSNKTRGVEDPKILKLITEIVYSLIQES